MLVKGVRNFQLRCYILIFIFYIASISCAPLSVDSPLAFSIIDLHLADASRILDLGLVAIKIEAHLDHMN